MNQAAAWHWQELHFMGQRMVKASCSIKAAGRSEAVLRLPPDWAFVWQGKDTQDWQAGWGMALRLDHQSLAQADVPATLTVFGGFPFADGASFLDDWGELSESLWFIPRFLWQQTGEIATIDIVAIFDESMGEVAFLADLATQGRDFFRAMQRGSWHARASLDAYVACVPSPNKLRWQQMVAEAKAAIANLDFAKVVLSRQVHLEFKRSLCAADVFRELRAGEEESFLFACQSPSSRVFMGRSPERLLSWQKDEFQMDAIAGTRGRSSTLPGDQAFARELQNSPKEQSEHRLVAVAIAKILEQAAIPFQRVDEEQILRLQHVQHLRSRFKGRLPIAWRPLELLHKLHPTPAVGGYPRMAAVKFLAQAEGCSRGWFAGGIGLIQGDTGDFAVGIRSALVHEKKLSIFAGAGIVAASEAEAEWQETAVKMRNFLGLWPALALKFQPSPISGDHSTR